MRFFKREDEALTGERLPAFMPTSCIKDMCPNFSGATCTNPQMEWISAGGPIERRDTSKPPLRDEATYIIYGQMCLAGTESKLVAQRVEVFKPKHVDEMMLMAVTGRSGEMPVEIVVRNVTSSVATTASSK